MAREAFCCFFLRLHQFRPPKLRETIPQHRRMFFCVLSYVLRMPVTREAKLLIAMQTANVFTAYVSAQFQNVSRKADGDNTTQARKDNFMWLHSNSPLVRPTITRVSTLYRLV